MSVATLNPDPTDALVGRIVAEIRSALVSPDLSAVHEVIREAGIRRARAALAEAPDHLAEAQAAYREAQAIEGAARERYQQALVEAEWEVAGQVFSDGNKKYRWVPCGEHGDGEPTPLCTECNGSGRYRLFMLADDVAKWKAATAASQAAVVLLATALRRAEEDTAAARDAVGVADKRLSAAKYEVQAAIAELNALAVGLASKETSR